MREPDDLPFETLTAEELARAEAISAFPPLLVRASAGSGKTYDLVVRSIGLMACGVDPRRILATTFTRKAAGEILGRIFRRLALAALDSDERAQLNRDLPGSAALSAEKATTLLGELCAALPRLQVETLDALFHRLAAGFSFRLGFPPEWSIADPATLASIRRRAVHDLLEEDPKAAVELMRRLHKGEVRRSITEQVDQLVLDLHFRWLESPAEAWQMIEVPPMPNERERANARGALLGLPIPRGKNGKENKSWLKVRDDLIEAIDREDPRDLAENGLVRKVLNGETTYSRCLIEPEWADALAVPIAVARAQLLTELRDQNRATQELIAAYDRCEARRRDERGLYDFQTVTRRLAERSITAEMLEVYERLDARIDHVLLDEFQDTSLLQYAVLAPMLRELLADLPQGRSFYCVGDVKQAIYGWRGGRRALFDAIEGESAEIEVETKAKSWRSSPVILDTVNRVFDRLPEAFLGDGEREIDRRAAEAWSRDYPPHAAARPIPGSVTLQIATATEEEEHLDPRELPYARTIDQIAQWRAQDPTISIGVLLRKNDRVAPLIDLLRERGIDASQEGGNPLTDSPAVNRILALLHFADHPGDRAAHYAVTTTPLGEAWGLGARKDRSTNARAARRLRTHLLEQGYGETVRSLAETLAPICDDRDRQRLDQLIELAYRFGDETGLRPSEFVERVGSTPVAASTGAPVQVMTMHRSKGLEFDAVILPQLTDSWFTPTPHLLASASHPLSPADRLTRYVNRDLRTLLDPEVGEIYRGYREEIVTEAISLLYVALTRARRALSLWLPPEKLRDAPSFARILRLTLGGGAKATLDGTGETMLYELGDPDLFGDSSTTAETPEVPASVRLPIVPAGDRAIAPQEAAGARFAAKHRAKRIGTALHAILEDVEWSSDEHPPRPGPAVARLPDGSPSIIEAAHQSLTHAWQRAATREIFDRTATLNRLNQLGEAVTALCLSREVAIGECQSEGPVMSVIDRLHVGERDGQVVSAEIIDFKTSERTGTDFDEELRDQYTDQLERYRAAVAQLTGLPAKRIAARLVSFPAGRVIELPLSPGPTTLKGTDRSEA